MKPKHQRLFLVVASVVFLCSATLLAMKAFRANLVYFYTPSDIAASGAPSGNQVIRVGGIVKLRTLRRTEDGAIEFMVFDGTNDILVHFKGMPPSLLRPGQGVIAEGVMTSETTMDAETLLTKHDEQYMPKEVVESLKKSGYWQKQYGK